MRSIGSAMVAFLLAMPLVAASPITRETLSSGGRERVYYLFIPQRPAGATAPMPLVITLHGSGHDGRILVEHWQRLAGKEGIVVAGPDSTNPQEWRYPIDGPELLRDVVNDVAKKATIDPRRIYLFGHSAGAMFGLQIALLESEYFAALAAHAGNLRPSDYDLIKLARRKVPIWIVVGTNDAFFPLSDVRATRDELQKNGLPVELWEMPRHTHDYYGSSRQINDRAWQFLSKTTLDRDPRYVEYAH